VHWTVSKKPASSDSSASRSGRAVIAGYAVLVKAFAFCGALRAAVFKWKTTLGKETKSLLATAGFLFSA
jgi:hypothetical protein